MLGEGCGPLVDGAALEFDVVTAQEALALAVVRKVVAVFVANDLADEGGAAKGAGDGGMRGGLRDGGGLFVVFAYEFGSAGDTPVDGGAGDFEFAVFAHFDLAVIFGVGFDFVGDGFLDDDAFEGAGKELLFTTTGSLAFSFWFCVFFPLLVVLFGVGGGFGFSQDFFSEVEVFLGGVVAFGLFPKELLAVVFVELEGGGEGIFELGDASFEGCEFLG